MSKVSHGSISSAGFALMHPKDSPRTARIAGALLAMTWLCGGVAALVAAAVTGQWLLGLAGLLALWYGVIWTFVARKGRRLTVREALAPWRLTHSPGADTSRRNTKSY